MLHIGQGEIKQRSAAGRCLQRGNSKSETIKTCIIFDNLYMYFFSEFLSDTNVVHVTHPFRVGFFFFGFVFFSFK